jgi:hypothetical protein
LHFASFTAPDFGRESGMFPYKIRAHPPEAHIVNEFN